MLVIPGLLGVLVGLVCGFVFPQRYKLVLDERLEKKERDRKIQRVSFFAAALPCLLLWPLTWNWSNVSVLGIYGIIVGGLIASVVIGCTPPFTYKRVMNWLYKKGYANPARWSADSMAEQRKEKRAELLKEIAEAGFSDQTLMAASKSLKTVEQIYDKTVMRKIK